MEQQKARYVNPFTDYGFKKIFGEEYNADLLIDFLNQLLKKEQGQIKKITYLKSERLGGSISDRKAVFDLYCENEVGEKFWVVLEKSRFKGSFLTELYARCGLQGRIVEMQKTKFYYDNYI